MTPIEVIVSVAIIAIIASLLLVAIGHVRESGRVLQCKDRLRSLGVAIHNFESAKREFPMAADMVSWLPIAPTIGTEASPHVNLLPYLGEANISSELARQTRFAGVWDPNGSNEPWNRRVPAFICPSDDPGTSNRAGNSYRACLGVGPDPAVDPGATPSAGAFNLFQHIHPSDVRDGLGSTISMSERLRGGWSENQFGATDTWYTGLDALNPGIPPPDLMTNVCMAAPIYPIGFYEYSGSQWHSADFNQTWYNHLLGPNAPVPGCSALSMSGEERRNVPNALYGLFTASSHHSGGVNCVFLDGSVRLISNTVDLSIWQALSTIASGDKVGEF